MAVKRGLGRGLDSLFEENGGLEEQSAGQTKLRIMDVEPNREQPRTAFDETALAELTKSVAEHGVLQPILVRPLPSGAYQIIAGERRWRAARAAGLGEIPVVIRELTDEQAMAAALIENLQREDLNPMEEAAGYQKLMDTFDLTQEEVAGRLGKSRPAVANALRLLKLPGSVQGMVREGFLSAGHARALLGVDPEAGVEIAANQMVRDRMSVREAERYVKQFNKEQSDQSVRVKPDTQRRRAVFFDEVELSLGQALGRKIKVVTPGKEDRGQLVIDFFDREDLYQIAQALDHLEYQMQNKN
ncbi:MAG: ParB/RepB/Spo0J family partition protein [Oscillospiraceae bacterium]|jgi:ParB family chromosome partitioning protein|nr:ParB/RepB/Spo0J family partition protein [Oscillospiraceae bacterium]